MKEIKLTRFGVNQGKYIALIDDEDFERVSQFNWCAVHRKNTIYASRSVIEDGKRVYYYLHRFIMNTPRELNSDHIDHDGLNCQKYNLRDCTQQQNLRNKKHSQKVNYKGAHWSKRAKKWQSAIYFNKKLIHLGYFKTEIEAANAYDAKANELYGEFAYLNFPEKYVL